MIGGPLALIWGPVIYIFVSVLSLSQFKIAYGLFARLATQKAGGNPVLQAVGPTLRQQLAFFESIFGQPASFAPSTTHVLLVAIMIVLIVNRR